MIGPEIDFADIARIAPDGLVIELGVFSGTTFERICAAFAPRRVYGFDWFHGLPAEWGRDPIGTFTRYGEPPARIPANGELVVGLVEDTLEPFLREHGQPVAFVHFDLDIYQPTRFALDKLPWQPGSILAFDEICGEPRNCEHEQRALWEWAGSSRYMLGYLGRTHQASWVVQVQ